MVGHDDGRIQVVSLTIEVPQRIKDDLGQFTSPQNTLAMALVKTPIPESVALLLIAGTMWLGNRVNVGKRLIRWGIDSDAVQPVKQSNNSRFQSSIASRGIESAVRKVMNTATPG